MTDAFCEWSSPRKDDLVGALKKNLIHKELHRVIA
jgi:hypothetical protein